MYCFNLSVVRLGHTIVYVPKLWSELTAVVGIRLIYNGYRESFIFISEFFKHQPSVDTGLELATLPVSSLTR